MDVPPSPDCVFDFPMARPEPHPTYDFFAAELIRGLAEVPGNMNRWIEEDVPLLGEMGEPMEIPGGAEEAGLDLLFGDYTNDDDDEGDWEDDDEWLMAPVTPPGATVTLPSTYGVGGPSTTIPGTLLRAGQPYPNMAHGISMPPSVIEDLCVRMGNLEYGNEALVKKMGTVSDAQVADSIVVGEIWPRVTTVEGQVQVMASQAVQVMSRLEEIETRVHQVESRVNTHPSGIVTGQGQDVIVGLSQQVQTLQTSLHGAELQNQQLQTSVAEMESCKSTLMSYMLWMEERLAVLEKKLPGPPPGPQ
ncbi:hypothetical protein Tco_0052751 [Tanacetum coccineum]